MKGPNVKSEVTKTGKAGQRGAAAVEFALIASFFLLLLLGIVEFGRFLFLFNTVQEITRCAARQAVVRWTDQVDGIQRACVFQEGSTGEARLPGAPEMTNARLRIRFVYNVNGDPTNPLPVSPEDNIRACSEAPASGCIRFVEASIQDCPDETCQPVSYQPMIGLFPFLSIDIPASTVRMPVESLGYRG